MSQSINLIPKEVKTEQVKVQVVKASTFVTIFILLVVGGVSGFFVYNNISLKAKIEDNEVQIGKLRKDIEDMDEIEVVARNLDKKFISIKDILGSRLYFSLLMKELEARIPPDVTITEFILNKAGTISIDGVGQNYLSISSFFTNLGNLSEDLESKPEDFFTDVTLNSVSFDNRDNTAKYSITTKFSAEVLKK